MSDYKLVPVEPTAEMIDAAAEAYMPFGDMDIALRMALLAAPAVQGEPAAWVTADTVDGQAVNGKPRRIWWENNEGVGMPIYAAPQPAPDVAALAARLSKVIRDLESGFVACERCGDQEDTATLDCMPELTAIRNDLAAYRKGAKK